MFVKSGGKVDSIKSGKLKTTTESEINKLMYPIDNMLHRLHNKLNWINKVNFEYGINKNADPSFAWYVFRLSWAAKYP